MRIDHGHDDLEDQHHHGAGQPVHEHDALLIALGRIAVGPVDEEGVDGHLADPPDGAQQAQGNGNGQSHFGADVGGDGQGGADVAGHGHVGGHGAAHVQVAQIDQVDGGADDGARHGIAHDQARQEACHNGTLEHIVSFAEEPGRVGEIVEHSDNQGLQPTHNK